MPAGSMTKLISFNEIIVKYDMTKMRRNTNTSKRCLSEKQLSRLLLYVENEAEQARQLGGVRAIVNELIILLLSETGLRAREVCRLNISDLKTDHGTNAVHIRNDEGDVTRIIEISENLAERFGEYISLYRKDPQSQHPLFVSERGGRLAYMSLYSKVKKIGKKTSIGVLNPQMLRHTHLVRFFRHNRNLRLVQQRAGHADISTTKALYSLVRTKPRTGKQNLPETAAVVISSPGKSKQNLICEVCEEPIFEGNGTRIDSGQFFCPDCLEEFQAK